MLMMIVNATKDMRLISSYATLSKNLFVKDFVVCVIVFYIDSAIIGETFELMFCFDSLHALGACLHKMKHVIGGMINDDDTTIFMFFI